MYLYKEGHTVTGVEGVPFVVEQFFRENKLDYEKISMPEIKGWKFKVLKMLLRSSIKVFFLTLDKRRPSLYLRL